MSEITTSPLGYLLVSGGAARARHDPVPHRNPDGQRFRRATVRLDPRRGVRVIRLQRVPRAVFRRGGSLVFGVAILFYLDNRVEEAR